MSLFALCVLHCSVIIKSYKLQITKNALFIKLIKILNKHYYCVFVSTRNVEMKNVTKHNITVVNGNKSRKDIFSLA